MTITCSKDHSAPSLSAHAHRVLALLQASNKPLVAYDILEKLRPHGIKAPPTVYRALESLMRAGLAHRIESLNAFVACHGDHHDGHVGKTGHFALCKDCGATLEIHQHDLCELLDKIGKKMNFAIDCSILELHGACANCAAKQEAA